MRISPTAEGFKLIFRHPVIALAEVAWRWTFAIAAWFLASFFMIEYAGSLPVRALDRLLLSSQQPVLMLRALERIFHGSALRFTKGAILVTLALTVAWILLAAFGRLAVLRALLERFGLFSEGRRRRALFGLCGLNLLRAGVTLAAAACVMGAIFIPSSIWASTHVSAADVARLTSAGLFLTWIAWVVLNWFLTTAAIFVCRHGNGVLEALASPGRCCQERPGILFAVGVWFGLAHLGAFITAIFAGMVIFGAIGVLKPGLVFVLEIMLVLCYLIVADFLYVSRLAAYVAMTYGEQLPAAAESASPTISPSAVDACELILSDVPLAAT